MLYIEPSIETPVQKVSVRVQLLVFFVLCFVIGWIAWLPLILNPKSPQPLSILGLFAPAISATLVSWWAQGRAGVTRLFKRLTIWRFSIGWYGLALLLMPLVYTLALLFVTFVAHASLGNLFFDSSPIFLIVAYIYLMVLNSGEEIGWRGFALPLLQQSLRNPLLASILLGLIWGLWHFPLYIYPDLATMPYPLFLLFTIGLSVVYMFLFNQSKGSLLPALMLHAATDWLPRLINLMHVGVQFWVVVTVLVWIAALALIFWLYIPALAKSKRELNQLESEKS